MSTLKQTATRCTNYYQVVQLPRFTSWHENCKLETPAPEGKICCFATKLSKRGDQHIKAFAIQSEQGTIQTCTRTFCQMTAEQ